MVRKGSIPDVGGLTPQVANGQTTEGVNIVAGDQTILLNSKEEFLQGAVPSTRTQRGFGR